MTPAERVAVALAERFAGLDAGLLARRPPFRSALAAALGLMGEEAVVAEVVALGDLRGSQSSYGVVIARLRELPALLADRDRIADEVFEERRWAKVHAAARQGATLRALVDRGQLYADEAREALSRELADADLRAVALAALGGVER